jgi:hypothetical protein
MSRLAALRAQIGRPPRGRSGPWLVALGIALILAIQPIWRDSVAVAVAGALGLTMIAAARWQLRWLPVLVVLGCGIALRLAQTGNHASDVSDVTEYAIRTMLSGGDPYGVPYNVSNPPGAAYPYGPINLLWYLPAYGDPTLVEFAVSTLLLLYFAYRAGNGRPIGLAILALAPPLVLASIDGSNDTSAGVLILAALALSIRRPLVGAAVLAIAVAFKPYAIAWLPGMIAWAGIPALVVFVGASVAAWFPVLFVWGPGSYLKSLSMAQDTHLRMTYWSVGSILNGIQEDLAPKALETIRYAVSGAAAVFGAMRIRSIDGVIVVGTISFVIAQFGGYFGSYVYLAAVAPLLCWRVDDWLRMGIHEVARGYDAQPGIGKRFRRPVAEPALPVLAPRVGAPARLAVVQEPVDGAPARAPLPASSSRASRTPTG